MDSSDHDYNDIHNHNVHNNYNPDHNFYNNFVNNNWLFRGYYNKHGKYYDKHSNNNHKHSINHHQHSNNINDNNDNNDNNRSGQEEKEKSSLVELDRRLCLGVELHHASSLGVANLPTALYKLAKPCDA